MINSLTQTQLIRARKAIINVDINAQIKAYQKQLLLLLTLRYYAVGLISFAKKNVTDEYNSILEKIKLLRQGKLKGKLPTL